MAAELRTEQSESGSAYSPAQPNFEVQNLWTSDNIQALNQRTETPQSLPQFPSFNLPGDSVGVIAHGADGFALYDGDLLASKDIAKADKQPFESGTELINIAEKLGQDPHRWESKTTGKCNLFVDAVFRSAHMPLPWDSAHIPDSHGMKVALDKECQNEASRWHKVYTYDSQHGPDSDQRFTHYQPKDGDVMIWDKVWGNKWVQHSGITKEPYDIIYAGARDQPHRPPKHGIGTTNIYNFTGHEPYGSPSAVYRYHGLD